MLKYPFDFQKIKGKLLARVSRFVVEVEVRGIKSTAYLPNPGRLWELLLPGTELTLSPDLSKGKLPYTVLGCCKNNQHVLLHTHLTNKMIHSLLNSGSIKSFKNYRVIREEPVYGRHRFDLLLENRISADKYFLEIKSSTLFAGSFAMFPDAVTLRGTNHLRKLEELSLNGVKTGCLFVVMSPEADYFLPAYSIDPLFAQTFMDVKNKVALRALAVGFDHSLSEVSTIREIDIPYDLIKQELQDRGYYLLLISLDKSQALKIGSLGTRSFPRGYYVYVGSAKRRLTKRIARHTRISKNKHWHIDHLTTEANKIVPIPIVSSDNGECVLAKTLGSIADYTVNGFGSSDCQCPGHLFYFNQHPLQNPSFVETIQEHRILRLDGKINSGS
jgi:sugar fermentation stimulation protein A